MTATAHGAKRTILCVEDEQHLRRDILEELVAAGYEAVGAATGREALRVLGSARPDLILCDISMPELDGHGFLKILRAEHPELAHVPLVFLTALDGRDAIIGGKRAGADDYLVKPVDYDLMLATIEARLREVGRIDESARHMRHALSAVKSGHPTTSVGMYKVLDLLSFGVVLLSAKQVVFANRFARSIHDAGDGLSISDVIHTDTASVTADIRTRWQGTNAAALEGRDCVSSLAIPRRSGGRDLHLTLCALPNLSPGTSKDALTAAFISDPQNRPTVPTGVLEDLFDLTPTEVEVASLLAHGLRSDEIARELSIAPTTVAFHLRNLFDKTDTHRQADLIVLLLTGLTSIEPLEAIKRGTSVS
ncbi:response regulator [Pseudosulfitobacter pseudonitzschiae]|uniref:response regulator n=1 Tax=Pseudosulfitobacter pseudonitzschiae TaxID=1402135 RepID=UPI001AF5F5EA|nr:response regulator [Pseudosulfitobacter pseudonitzschiae]MBM1817447.1 response regulator [Pseudosulfitobacter pseudonitzschiae]MBM1835107.1 response regulator [Pseudosulfitobacter pseudonitzschiae]MBM1839980.1 response regulator [Pseudosulfitobacter pseudonitzschiae]MBM1844842.1 response regulator [Pseudosulfitobacter pseudonitzschiae]MBM1849642.1 response regulator [Pseudosulfitobacter pseudonitzschiae]